MNTQTSPLYKELGVLKIQDLYYYNLAVLVHDYFYNINFPEALKEKFETSLINNPITTRNHKKNLVYKIPNLISTYKKPSIAGSIYWNKLPNKLKEIETKNKFKNDLKRYFLDTY